VRKPTPKERNVLDQFVFDIPEPWGRFAGAGAKTRESLLQEGWIEPNTDPTYPREYYQITTAGKAALDA